MDKFKSSNLMSAKVSFIFSEEDNSPYLHPPLQAIPSKKFPCALFSFANLSFISQSLIPSPSIGLKSTFIPSLSIRCLTDSVTPPLLAKSLP